MPSIYCRKCATRCQASDQVCKACGNNLGLLYAAAAKPEITKSEKSGITTFLLCYFFGFLGVHRFYVGKIGTGILMLITLGGLSLWYFIDLITIARLKFTDKKGHVIELTSSDPATKSEKSGSSALLLALFLGFLGAHRFYVGKTGTGILMLITFGGLGIWQIIDVIVIAAGEFTDKNEQFLLFTQSKVPRISDIFKVIGAIMLAYIAFMALIYILIIYSMGGPVLATLNQLATLQDHDYAKAYSYTSSDYKKVTSLEAFKQFVISNPAINDNKNFEYSEIDINGIGIISGTLEARDGSKMFVTYKVIKERGKWKIDKIDLQK